MCFLIPRVKTNCSMNALCCEDFFIPLICTREGLVLESLLDIINSSLNCVASWEKCGKLSDTCLVMWRVFTPLKITWACCIGILFVEQRPYLNGSQGERFSFKDIIICNGYRRLLLYPEGICDVFEGVRQKHPSIENQLDILKVLSSACRVPQEVGEESARKSCLGFEKSYWTWMKDLPGRLNYLNKF